VDHYRLFFTQRALNDLANIVGYIAEDDDEAASRFGAALLDHVDLLRFPRMGTVTRKRSPMRGNSALPARIAQADEILNP
jgi:plasmid stabilization system protein ParE